MYDNLNCVTDGFRRRAEELGNDKAWILRAENSQRKETQKILATMDNITAQMPNTEKENLAQRFSKIIPDKAKQFRDEYDEQFLDALVEVLGYGFLQKEYPSCKVQFSEPDLIAINDRDELVAAIACKRIQTSDEHKDYVKHHQGEVKEVDHRIVSDNSSQNPLLRKVQDTLSKAENQLAQNSATDRFIFINFSWDLSAQILEKEVKDLIQKLGKELRGRGIILIAIENLGFYEPFVFTKL